MVRARRKPTGSRRSRIIRRSATASALRAAIRRRPAHLSAREQSGVDGATDEVLDALAEGNRAYEERFGYIFIVCATGKSAAEMLALLRARLPNPPDVEIRIAAEEQAQITALRLMRLKIG